jgi:hypothetical protein
MVNGVTKGKWMVTVAKELGFGEIKTEMVLGTDSSAAKSFASRRGIGRMRHIEVRDLWLTEEVKKGSVKINKVRGDENPADLMTKFLGKADIEERLSRMGVEVMR